MTKRLLYKPDLCWKRCLSFFLKKWGSFLPQDGMNALHLSAKCGHTNIIDVIVSNKAKIEKKLQISVTSLWQSVSSKTGFNVLHVATQSGNVSAHIEDEKRTHGIKWSVCWHGGWSDCCSYQLLSTELRGLLRSKVNWIVIMQPEDHQTFFISNRKKHFAKDFTFFVLFHKTFFRRRASPEKCCIASEPPNPASCPESR